MVKINVRDLEVAQAKIISLSEKPNNQKFYFPDWDFRNVISKFTSPFSTAGTLDALKTDEEKKLLVEIVETPMPKSYEKIILKIANEKSQILSGLLPVSVFNNSGIAGVPNDVLKKLGRVEFGVMKSQLQIDTEDALPCNPILYTNQEVDYPVYWDSMYDFSTSHLLPNTVTDSPLTADDAYDSAIINVSAELESSGGSAVIRLENYKGYLFLSEYVNVTRSEIKSASFVSFHD